MADSNSIICLIVLASTIATIFIMFLLMTSVMMAVVPILTQIDVEVTATIEDTPVIVTVTKVTIIIVAVATTTTTNLTEAPEHCFCSLQL